MHWQNALLAWGNGSMIGMLSESATAPPVDDSGCMRSVWLLAATPYRDKTRTLFPGSTMPLVVLSCVQKCISMCSFHQCHDRGPVQGCDPESRYPGCAGSTSFHIMSASTFSGWRRGGESRIWLQSLIRVIKLLFFCQLHGV